MKNDTPALVKSALQDVFERQHAASRAHAPLPLARRLEALDTLLNGVLQWEQRLIDALHADFGNRSSHETQLLELFPLVDEIRHIKRNLRRWMRPR
ncbi:MAG TPA: coniferyl aldehyde dehydrogenase, partial [Noviherbaspirillum sp.]|nr:coniferyl aldehyde dehydrogenase [Noviherbaspirillum sp.]